MSDPEEKSPTGDRDSVNGREEDAQHSDLDSDAPQLEERELDDMPKLTPNNHSQKLGQRQSLQQLQQAQEISEVSSVDGSLVDSIPRQAGSPIGSVTSGQGESIQVCQVSSAK